MDTIDATMKMMTFEFFGQGRHKVSPAAILADKDIGV